MRLRSAPLPWAALGLLAALAAGPAAAQNAPYVIDPALLPPPSQVPPEPKPIVVNVQPPVVPRTHLRSFVERPDLLVVGRSRKMPSIGLSGGAQLVVAAMGAFEPGHEEERMLGVRFTLTAPDLTSQDGVVYLDVPEVDPLVRAIDTLEDVASEPKGDLVTEADFVTLEGFAVGVVSEGGRVQRYVEVGPPDARRRFEASPAAFRAIGERLTSATQQLFN